MKYRRNARSLKDYYLWGPGMKSFTGRQWLRSSRMSHFTQATSGSHSILAEYHVERHKEEYSVLLNHEM